MPEPSQPGREFMDCRAIAADAEACRAEAAYREVESRISAGLVALGFTPLPDDGRPVRGCVPRSVLASHPEVRAAHDRAVSLRLHAIEISRQNNSTN